jgi:hypothetical protein
MRPVRDALFTFLRLCSGLDCRCNFEIVVLRNQVAAYQRSIRSASTHSSRGSNSLVLDVAALAKMA